MNKTQGIREVVSHNFTLTNEDIKREVKRSYGLIVESNSIWAAIGPEKQRRGQASYADHLIKEAQNLIRNAGSFKQAKNLLYVAGGKMNV